MKARLTTLSLLGPILALLVACGPGARDKALRGTLTGVTAARAAMVTWDASTQDRIVADSTSREQGQAALAEHREDRAVLVAAFEASYFAIAIAATDLNDQTLSQAVVAATKLYALYQRITGAPAPAAGGTR